MRKYGITEKKKAELDLLTRQVLEAQYEVQQQQAIVDSFTNKLSIFQQWLADAEAKRTQALNNRNSLESVVNNIRSLRNTSFAAFDKMGKADEKVKEMAKMIKVVIDKLIYSAELLDRLSNLVIRKKAQNLLISDELIDKLNTAGKDANNAVSLALVALKSTYAAQATSTESEGITALEYLQATALYELITGWKDENLDGPLSIQNIYPKKDKEEEEEEEDDDSEAEKNIDKKRQRSLSIILDEAYRKADINYNEAKSSSERSQKQLNYAITELTTAQITLKSLQSGLAAANAAALAS